MTLRVGVDYNTIETKDERTRVFINTQVLPHLLEHLRPGLPVVLYDSESLEVDAVVEFDGDYQEWWAVPDWSTRHDLPPLEDES